MVSSALQTSSSSRNNWTPSATDHWLRIWHDHQSAATKEGENFCVSPETDTNQGTTPYAARAAPLTHVFQDRSRASSLMSLVCLLMFTPSVQSLSNGRPRFYSHSHHLSPACTRHTWPILVVNLFKQNNLPRIFFFPLKYVNMDRSSWWNAVYVKTRVPPTVCFWPHHSTYFLPGLWNNNIPPKHKAHHAWNPLSSTAQHASILTESLISLILHFQGLSPPLKSIISNQSWPRIKTVGFQVLPH